MYYFIEMCGCLIKNFHSKMFFIYITLVFCWRLVKIQLMTTENVPEAA